MKAEELRKLYREYRIAERICDRAEAAYEADCENEAVEAEFDRTYKESCKILDKLIGGIVEITGGRIDKKTARMMIITKNTEMEAILTC